jgi:DNA-binding NarL/FixJ family response regulator
VIQVYGKLQVSDRVDAALYAERHGLRVSGDAHGSSA